MSGENVCGRTFGDIFQMFGLVHKQDASLAAKQFPLMRSWEGFNGSECQIFFTGLIIPRKEKRKDSRKRSRPFGTTCQTQEIPVSQGQPVTQPRCSFKPHWVLMDGVLGFWWLKETLGGPPVSPAVSLLILHSSAEPCRSRTGSKAAE